MDFLITGMAASGSLTVRAQAADMRRKLEGSIEPCAKKVGMPSSEKPAACNSFCEGEAGKGNVSAKNTLNNFLSILAAQHSTSDNEGVVLQSAGDYSL